jgi:hypothetical protein
MKDSAREEAECGMAGRGGARPLVRVVGGVKSGVGGLCWFGGVLVPAVSCGKGTIWAYVALTLRDRVGGVGGSVELRRIRDIDGTSLGRYPSCISASDESESSSSSSEKSACLGDSAFSVVCREGSDL